jgi:hypothetical protein
VRGGRLFGQLGFGPRLSSDLGRGFQLCLLPLFLSAKRCSVSFDLSAKRSSRRAFVDGKTGLKYRSILIDPLASFKREFFKVATVSSVKFVSGCI